MAEEYNDKINGILGKMGEKNEKICTGWFIIAEWIDGENNYEITAWSDGASAPWKYDGMLNYAVSQELAYENEEEDD